MVKIHRDRIAYEREISVLMALAGRLPVPKPLEGSGSGTLRLPYVTGINGADLVDGGNPGQLMAELGRFLRTLHEVEVSAFGGVLPGSAGVIVHGDFGHYNAIMAADGSRLAAVLDWEEAHLGDAAEDIGWCEFQLRSRHPQHEWAVRKLLEAYGDPPDADRRERAVRVRMEELSARARRERT